MMDVNPWAVIAAAASSFLLANRPFSALSIDGGYHTVQFMLYGLILGAWH